MDAPTKNNSGSEDKLVKNTINNTCTGCGLCAVIDPEHFKMNEDTGKAEPIIKEPIPLNELMEIAKNACPVSAIILENTKDGA